MNAVEFATIVLTLASRFRFSVTSWGRTAKRNAAVSGKANSRHLFFCAADCILDDPTEAESFKAEVKRFGLRWEDEGDHIHIQTS